MAVVVGGVVHEHGHRTRLRLDGGEARAQRLDVREIALQELRRAFKPIHERTRFGLGNVQEKHARLLAHESANDLRADAGTASRDDDRPVG